MRVLLASAPHRDTFGYSMPPPGLLRLGGELVRRGVDVALEDMAYRVAAGELSSDDRMADEGAASIVARGELDLLGLSVMGATLPIALAIASRVRARLPNLTTVLGGPGTTGIDREILERFPFIDAVVRGEGEITLAELVDRVERRADHDAFDAHGIAGVTWRSREGTIERECDREPMRDLFDLAPYAWDLLPPIAAYKRITGGEDGLVALDSGRGCVFDCSFCTIGRFWNRRSRTVPAKRLAEEVVELTSIDGARAAYLCHDIFGANRGQAVAFCEEMIARGNPMPWEVRARADHLDRELCDLMGRAGCYRVLIGVESADARVREQNQKGMRADIDLLQVVQDCTRAGITPILSLILGLPGEDDRALRTSLDFCARASLHAGVNLSLHLVNPQPGCALGEEFGARSRRIAGIEPDMARGAGETSAERELIERYPEMFSTWALLPGDDDAMRDLATLAAELPEVLMRYPRTFALLACSIGERHLDALDLYRAWQASERSFEAFARAARVPWVDDTLRWEQALVRAQARGESTAAPSSLGQHATAPSSRHEGTSASRDVEPLLPDPTRAPRLRGQVLAFEFDLPPLSDRLLNAERVRTVEPRPTWLCVLPTSRGARTLRISRDVARVASLVDGRTSMVELEARHPGIEHALEKLSDSGLVELGTARRSSERAIESGRLSES